MEKIILCSECGESNEIGLKTCIKCGNDLTQYLEKKQLNYTLQRDSVYNHELLIYSNNKQAVIGKLHEKLNMKRASLFCLFLLLTIMSYILIIYTIIFFNGSYRVLVACFFIILSIIIHIGLIISGLNSIQFALDLEGKTEGLIKTMQIRKVNSYFNRNLWSYTNKKGENIFKMVIQTKLVGIIQNKDGELQFNKQEQINLTKGVLNQLTKQNITVASLNSDNTGKRYDLIIEDSMISIELAFFYAFVLIYRFYTLKKY